MVKRIASSEAVRYGVVGMFVFCTDSFARAHKVVYSHCQ